MSPTHDERVRREFARQAEAYAASPSVSRPALVDWLVRLTDPRPGQRVLDVACGPAHVTLAFARLGCRVTGIDLTPETLRVARRRVRQEAPRAGAGLVCGNARCLAFRDASFDLCVCRSSFHHLPDPAAALSEMRRVTRSGGRVATLDHVTSEDAPEAAWHNQMETLRDPSHAACLSPSAWRRLYTEAGLLPDREESASFPFDFEEWYERAFQGAAVKERVRDSVLGHPSSGVPGLRLLSREPLTLQFDFLALSAPVS